MKVHVKVTQEDIDKGCRGEPYGANGGCMVWRALDRATEGALDGLVVGTNGFDYHGALWRTVPFPPHVGEKIERFDAGGHVEPFAFDIDLPTEALT